MQIRELDGFAANVVNNVYSVLPQTSTRQALDRRWSEAYLVHKTTLAAKVEYLLLAEVELHRRFFPVMVIAFSANAKQIIRGDIGDAFQLDFLRCHATLQENSVLIIP